MFSKFQAPPASKDSGLAPSSPDRSRLRLLAITEKIGHALEASQTTVKGIEDRGTFANLLASDREDLVTVARGQNSINSLMMEMMREIIAVNVMGYAYLASVINEFRINVKDGWTDADGRFYTLSKTGKDFADTATIIFTSILDGARSTQEAISDNAQAVAQAQHSLAELVAQDEKRVQTLRTLAKAMSDQIRVIATLEAGDQVLIRRMDEAGDVWRKGQSLITRRLDAMGTNLSDELATCRSDLQVPVAAIRAQAERMEHLEKTLVETRAHLTAMQAHPVLSTHRWLVSGLVLGWISLLLVGLKAFGAM